MRSIRLCRPAAGVLGAAALAITAALSSQAAGCITAAAAAPSPVALEASAPASWTAALHASDSPAAAIPPRIALPASGSPTAAAPSELPASDSPTAATPSRLLTPDSPTDGPAPAGVPCPLTMNVVAHEDDDLLFINPSVSADIAAGRCVVTLFVTAGDAGLPRFYWRGREEGSMAAYAAMAGVPSTWRADEITLAGHAVNRFRLADAKVTLLFLRLPDAHGSPTRPPGTLEDLWLGTITSLDTLDTDTAYTKQALIDTLTAAMDAYRPDQIRTLDYAGHYGDGDHADHHTVGYLTLAAQRDYRIAHRITAYMGYEVSDHPDDLGPAATGAKLTYFLAYARHDRRVCQSAEACQANFYGPRFSHSIETASS